MTNDVSSFQPMIDRMWWRLVGLVALAFYTIAPVVINDYSTEIPRHISSFFFEKLEKDPSFNHTAYKSAVSFALALSSRLTIHFKLSS
jgi:hypothetical protein